MKYFKNVQSFEGLKKQFQALAKENHPDCGGDAEIMKAINCEYDVLFPIWKNRYNSTSAEQTTETANSTRSKFYSQNGWEGSRHDWSRTTKEVASLVRAYVKEVYPTYKFSVRFSSASMCSEVHADLKEAPFEIYKTVDQLTEEDISEIIRKANRNSEWTLTSWYPEEAKTEIDRIWNKCGAFYRIYREDVAEMLKDIDAFVNSYNFNDCDGMTDYFHVDFYYFGCGVSNDFKVVEKNARIAEPKNEVAPVENIAEEYDIQESEHTKTGAKIWLVKIIKKLTRDEYLQVAQSMKNYGGYYSKFTHSFVFDHNPSQELKGGAAA